MDKLDWSLIRSFLAVAEHGSLSAAARALGVSQPTIGRHIQQLEQALSDALFIRQPRGLAPTVRATALLPDARRMRDAMQALELTALGQDQDLSGTVRITASMMMAHHSLPPIIADLRRTYPGIAVELVSSDASENLLFREADIALRMYRPTQGDVVTRKIAEIAIGLYAADSYLARHGIPRTPQDFAEHHFVGYDQSTLMIDGMAAVGMHVTREDFAVRCDNQVTYWELVRAGCGIGPTQVSVGDLTPGVQRILPDVPIPSLPLWLTAASAVRHTPRIRAVYDHLAAAFA